jgi:hypothetical protein
VSSPQRLVDAGSGVVATRRPDGVPADGGNTCPRRERAAYGRGLAAIGE